MKLYVASASPFGRKCAVLVHELGLQSRVEFEPATVSPINRNADIARGNPLVKIPTLILDDGSALFDSPVICEYFDSLSGTPRFFPAPGRLSERNQVTSNGKTNGKASANGGPRYQADKVRVAPSGRPIKTVNGGAVITGLL